MKLLALLEIAKQEANETPEVTLLRKVEKSVLNSLDNYGTQSENEQQKVIEFLASVDSQLANLGIYDFKDNSRLQNAYLKISALDSETFFHKGAFQAFRKLRTELWNTVESSS